ncbi:MAG: NAD(P)H:quinone oxidoreductase [Alphaproteobacteria bacterium]|nr:NAD(P)H:quinone oxidoreductase [Alphaproteobacteria bacterium]
MATNVLVAFYSRNGSTEALAKAFAEGAQSAGAETRLRRARDIVGADVIAGVPGWKENAGRMDAAYGAPTTADIEWADAVAFGTPTRFGNVSAELKAFIDSLGGLWFQGKINGKAGAAIVSTQTLHGGNETTLLTLYAPLAHLGFIIVPAGYVDPALFKAGTPYGASTVSGQNQPPTADDVAVAKVHGARVAKVAAALKAARG